MDQEAVPRVALGDLTPAQFFDQFVAQVVRARTHLVAQDVFVFANIP